MVSSFRNVKIMFQKLQHMMLEDLHFVFAGGSRCQDDGLGEDLRLNRHTNNVKSQCAVVWYVCALYNCVPCVLDMCNTTKHRLKGASILSWGSSPTGS